MSSIRIGLVAHGATQGGPKPVPPPKSLGHGATARGSRLQETEKSWARVGIDRHASPGRIPTSLLTVTQLIAKPLRSSVFYAFLRTSLKALALQLTEMAPRRVLAVVML